MPNTPLSYPVSRWKNGAWSTFDDAVSPEEPVRVVWPGGSCQLWAWPDDLMPLCLGHVLLDRLHSGPDDGPAPFRMTGTVRPLTTDGETRHAFEVRLEPLTPSASTPPAPVFHLSPSDIVRHMDAFLNLQGSCPKLWESTGCFHRAGMFDPESGSFLRMAEDIGRHNCLDRLAGWACLHGIDTARTVLFVSARITASLYAKARRAGFSVLVSRSAVTTAPVEKARQENHKGSPVTLIGFCRPREERFTIFADAGRIAENPLEKTSKTSTEHSA